MAEYTTGDFPILRFVGDGVTTVYDVVFPFYDEEDLDIYIGIDSVDLNIDYTVINTGESAVEGLGQVSFFTPPDVDAEITIIRETNKYRLTDFETASRFEEKLLDNEFNNYLRQIEDARVFLSATPHFHPRYIGEVDGTIENIVPLGILRINAAGTGFDFVKLSETQEFAAALAAATEQADIAAAQVALATTQANIATTQATNSSNSAAAALTSENNAATSYVGAEAARVQTLSYQDLAMRYAEEDFNVEVGIGTYSAKHWANQAEINANDALSSGGLFTPTGSSEYPSVAGITKDTLWVINIGAAPYSYTYTSGDLNGVEVTSGNYLFYDFSLGIFSYVLTASNVDWEGQVNEVLDMVGMMMWATGSQQPTGRWIQPAGFTLSRATYPELWAYAQSSGNLAVQASKLPHQYGDGDGSTTFSIPDLRGEFLRVWDDGRGVDSGRVFGTSQTDAVQAFSGSITSTGEDDAGVYNVKTSGGPFRTGGATRRRFESSPNNTNTCSNTLTFNNAWSQRTASETRPRNIALMLWLRY